MGTFDLCCEVDFVAADDLVTVVPEPLCPGAPFTNMEQLKSQHG